MTELAPAGVSRSGATIAGRSGSVVDRTGTRVLGFLPKRDVIAAASAPGDEEVTIVGDCTMGESDP